MTLFAFGQALIEPETLAKVEAALTPEDRARRRKMQKLVGWEGVVMGSAIEQLIRLQGLAETKRDLMEMADTIDRAIRLITPPTEDS